MIYVFGLLVSAFIIIGQVLWKVGVERSGFELTKHFILSEQIFRVIFSPYIMIGVCFYGFATLFYMALLSKFDYTNLQATVVSASLALTFVAAIILFGEKVSIINFVGLALLVMGVLLVTKY